MPAEILPTPPTPEDVVCANHCLPITVRVNEVKDQAIAILYLTNLQPFKTFAPIDPVQTL
jgi:hypothetical protein